MQATRERTPDGDIRTLKAHLAAGGHESFEARDQDAGSTIRIVEKDQDRYRIAILPPGGGGREEWRSGRWIELQFERGHWLLVRTAPPPPSEAPAPAGDAHPGAVRFVRPLRGGQIAVTLPPDITPVEADAALAEMERISAYLRAVR